MSITVEELRNMNPDTYQLIDIRSESEIAHGAIPGATAIPGEEISSSEQTDKTKKLIICCSRGRNSIDLAAELCEKASGKRQRFRFRHARPRRANKDAERTIL